MPAQMLRDFMQKIEYLTKKYATTLNDVVNNLKQTEDNLASMMDELTGNEHDMQGLLALQNLLKGE